jgi:hypothetical protein
MSFVRRSSVKSMSVRRPNELALVTGRPSITQSYGWCVWPVTNRSTASSVRFTMSTIGPDTLQALMPANGVGTPPS